MGIILSRAISIIPRNIPTLSTVKMIQVPLRSINPRREGCRLHMLGHRGNGVMFWQCSPTQVLVVADVSVAHPGAAKYLRAAAQTDGAAVASRVAEKRAKYGVGEQIAAGGFLLLSTETYGRTGTSAHKSLQMLAMAASRLQLV
jgi:hypothetical protein